MAYILGSTIFTRIFEWFASVGKDFYNAFIRDARYMLYLKGLGNTLLISLAACLLGLLLGVIVALVRIAPKDNPFVRFLDVLARLYVTVIRGTPVVVQLLIMYFVILASMANLADGIPVAIITFGINSGAYMAELLRGGFLGVENGQLEASRSLGFTWTQSMRYVIFPQAIKSAIPSMFNEFIALVKETSVAGYIAIMDLTKAGQIVQSRTLKAFPALILVALFYLVVVVLLTKVQKKIEKELAKND